MKKLILLLFIPLFFTCSSDSSDDSSPCPNQPQLTTNEVSDISVDSVTDLANATFSGEILNIQLGNNCEIFSFTNQGFVYSTSIQPTIEDNVVNANGESVTVSVDGLPVETTYYVRTFITNVLGTFYGNEVSFTTPLSTNPIYLDDNGITIKAKEWAEVGMTGVVDGITYTIVNEEMLYDMIDSEGNTEEDLTKICTSKITYMNNLFRNYTTGNPTNERTSIFNQNIGNWDTSNVVDMTSMFENTTFNQDISNWDVSNVVFMQQMFANSLFNKDIGSWDVSNVCNFDYMFWKSEFNSPIGGWEIIKADNCVLEFDAIFYESAFNQDISNWDVSNVTRMDMLFRDSPFNQDISNWDVGNVTDMFGMFAGNSSFNQDLSGWDVSSVDLCTGFCFETNWTLPKPNFSNCGDVGCD